MIITRENASDSSPVIKHEHHEEQEEQEHHEEHDQKALENLLPTAEPDEDLDEKSVKDLKTDLSPEASIHVASDVTANISGTINFKGDPVKGKKLRLPGICAKQFKSDVYSDESIVTNGKLANVLVRVSKGLEKSIYNDVPDEEVILDQKGCMYSPRVIAARVNQKVTFVNSDRTFHNVKSVTKKNKGFNIAMPKKNQRKTKTFSTPELFLKTKCSVHPWMQAFVAILDHPFFSVTSESGKYDLTDLPSGKYTLEAWHEVYGTLTKEIEVKDSKPLKLDFTFTRK